MSKQSENQNDILNSTPLTRAQLNEAFLSSVIKNDLDKVKQYLSNGADIDYQKGVALVYSISEDFKDMADFLLKNKINPFLGIQNAIINNEYKRVEHFLKFTPEYTTKQKGIFLTHAVSHDHLNVLDMLFKKLFKDEMQKTIFHTKKQDQQSNSKGYSYDSFTKYDHSTYNKAYSYDFFTLVQELFIKAAEEGSNQSMKYLFDHFPDIQLWELKTLEAAASFGHIEILKQLYNHGIKDNHPVKYYLFLASYNGELETCKYIMANDINEQNYETCLNGAISSFNVENELKLKIINYIVFDQKYYNFDYITNHKHFNELLNDWVNKYKPLADLNTHLKNNLIQNDKQINKIKI